MEAATGSAISNSSTHKEEDDEAAAVLPGFRFHPTDEELVGFYLKRKVEKKPFSIELIKHIDIYKFDPWDLPKGSNVGDKEWYFFCKRGRKYRNSIRPNRVTGSGFWKATGIDRPIYPGQGRHECIGLKKSLVYYRGSAGKGTKTDWMMHEFRLPSELDPKANIKHIDPKTMAQEAEVWTLCRILKRNVSYRKCMPDWRELSGSNCKQKMAANAVDASSKTCSREFDPSFQTGNRESNYISFTSNSISVAAAAPSVNNGVNRVSLNNAETANHHHHMMQKQQMVQLSSSSSHPLATSNDNNITNSSFHGSSLGSAEFGELLKHGDWDELRSLFESAAAAVRPM